MIRLFRGSGILGLAILIALVINAAAAANLSWSATASTDWSVASAWSTLSLPTSADSAFIVNGGTATITQPNAICSLLTLGGTGNGTVNMISGFLSVENSVYPEMIGNASPGIFIQSGGTHSIVHTGLYLGQGTASGTYALSGGSLSTPFVDVGNNGPGRFTQSGGTCSITTQLDEGVSLGSSGIYTLSGSGLLIAAQEILGDVTSGTLMQSGGTNSVANGLVLGQNLGATGTYYLNGGLLSLYGSLSVGAGSGTLYMNGGTLHSGTSIATNVPFVIGSGSNAELEIASGTMTISGNLGGSGKLTKSGSGILALSGTNTYSEGTIVYLGTLQVLSPHSLLSGSSLTVGSSASVYFGSSVVPVEMMNNPQAVPEPSTLASLILCAVGFGFSSRLGLLRRSLQRASAVG